MPPTDSELIQLLDRHCAALVLFARQWTDSAEDVVQDAFVQLMRQPTLPASPAAWLFHVVRNGAISAARAHARRTLYEQQAATTKAPWFEPAENARLDAEAVALALGQLPIEQREVVIARLWGGLAFEEIAAARGLAISTVHRRYWQAIAKLQTQFGARCQDSNCRKSP